MSPNRRYDWMSLGRPSLSHLKKSRLKHFAPGGVYQSRRRRDFCVFSGAGGVGLLVGFLDGFLGWCGIIPNSREKRYPNQNWQYSSSHSHGSWKWLPTKLSFTVGSFSTEL